MNKRVLVAALAIPALGPALWAFDIWRDRQIALAIVAPTPLLALPPHEYPGSNPVVGTLQPGEPIRVLRMRYGKDFQTFRIERPDGVEGWIIRDNGVEITASVAHAT